MVDVASLYTIISHQQGLEAVTFFHEQDHSLPQIQKHIIELLVFATGKNYFWFGDNFYLQTRGVAMDAKFVPSLANLFMAYWEKEVIGTNPRETYAFGGGTSMMSSSFGMVIFPLSRSFLQDRSIAI